MADVHFLREIRGGVIHHHRLRRSDGAEQRSCGIGRIRQQRVAQTDVDEAGAGDLDVLCDSVEIQLRNHRGGEFARIARDALRGLHYAVGLIVTELRARGRCDHGNGITHARRGHRGANPLVQ